MYYLLYNNIYNIYNLILYIYIIYIYIQGFPSGRMERVRPTSQKFSHSPPPHQIFISSRGKVNSTK